MARHWPNLALMRPEYGRVRAAWATFNQHWSGIDRPNSAELDKYCATFGGGAMINQGRSFVNAAWPSPHKACMRNDTDVALSLIEGHADPCCEDHRQWSPLIWAANHGNDVLTRVLIVKARRACARAAESQQRGRIWGCLTAPGQPRIDRRWTTRIEPGSTADRLQAPVAERGSGPVAPSAASAIGSVAQRSLGSSRSAQRDVEAEPSDERLLRHRVRDCAASEARVTAG